MTTTRLFVALLATVALSACTLSLDWSESGLSCGDGPNGETDWCLPGYVCNSYRKCVPESQGACQPSCSAFENCIAGECIGTCEGRPCGAAQVCAGGQCEEFKSSAAQGKYALGEPCATDSDCSKSPYADAFCLRPFDGGVRKGTGMCTTRCENKPKFAGGRAPDCIDYPDGTSTGGTIKIYAQKAFTPCTTEADCAPAGLSCGAYSVSPSGSALLACRDRVGYSPADVRSGQAPPQLSALREKCKDIKQCANGLCQITNEKTLLDSATCLTPCGRKADCDEKTWGADADCLPVVLNRPVHFDEELPSPRINLCIPGGPSRKGICASSGGDDGCHADAPKCLLNPDPTKQKEQCTLACASGPTQCESGYTPDTASVSGQCYCVAD